MRQEPILSNQNQDHVGASTRPESPTSSHRRKFLANVGGATVATMAMGIQPMFGSQFSNDSGGTGGRLGQATKIRTDAALRDEALGIPDHPNNGDEARYQNKIGNYSKGLKHNSIGEVNHDAYNALMDAIASGRFEDFESLANNGYLGCSDSTQQRRLVSPLAGFAFDLECKDGIQFKMRPAPAFSSAEEAGEMVELYWMALLRDVNFLDYPNHPLAVAAANDLSRLSDFRGPKVNGRVTPRTLFRDIFPGCTVGPYVSQFLLKSAPFGAQEVDQRIHTALPGIDFMTDFQSWLDIQNGCQPSQTTPLDGLYFCRNGRDLGQYVHVDALYQAYLVAALVLFSLGMPWDSGNPYGKTPEPGSGRPLPPGVPGAHAQVGFATFGVPHLLALLAEVSTRALKAVWYQKWLVHRRLRPEEFAGRVEVERRRQANYPIHRDLFNSSALTGLFGKNGNFLLPMAFPEGSPLHTAYGSGHSTVAGACVTILKAWFDETAVIPDPVVPSNDGTDLVPYQGPPLTVGGELNKIASNIAQGRNIAGVHWRSDATEAIKLGEEVALSVLRNQEPTYRESFHGFRLTGFDGTTLTT